MKLKWNSWLGVLLLATLGAAPGAVLAQAFDGPPGMQHGFGDLDRFAEHMTRFLDLDDTQAQSVRNIVAAAAPEMNDLRDRARENHEAIMALEVSDPEYDIKLSDLARQNGELASAATLLHGRLRAKLDALLTPEQRQKLADEAPRGDRSWRHHHRDKDAGPGR